MCIIQKLSNIVTLLSYHPFFSSSLSKLKFSVFGFILKKIDFEDFEMLKLSSIFISTTSKISHPLTLTPHHLNNLFQHIF